LWAKPRFFLKNRLYGGFFVRMICFSAYAVVIGVYEVIIYEN